MGCTTTLGRVALLTTKKDVDFSRFDRDKAGALNDMEAEDVSSIVFVVTTDLPPLIDEAANNLLNKGGGNVIVDATIERSSWYIPLIYGENTITVRGKVMALPTISKQAKKSRTKNPKAKSSKKSAKK